MSPKNKNMRHCILTSLFSLPLTRHRLPHSSFSTHPPARCQNLHCSCIYEQKASISLWLQQMPAGKAHSLLLLPVKSKAFISAQNRQNFYTARELLINVFRSELIQGVPCGMETVSAQERHKLNLSCHLYTVTLLFKTTPVFSVLIALGFESRNWSRKLFYHTSGCVCRWCISINDDWGTGNSWEESQARLRARCCPEGGGHSPHSRSSGALRPRCQTQSLGALRGAGRRIQRSLRVPSKPSSSAVRCLQESRHVHRSPAKPRAGRRAPTRLPPHGSRHTADPARPAAHLQPHVEHHGGDDVEVREVDAELPGQVEENEEGSGQPLAEHAIRPGRGRLGEPGSQGGQRHRHIPPPRPRRNARALLRRPLPALGAGCRQRGGTRGRRRPECDVTAARDAPASPQRACLREGRGLGGGARWPLEPAVSPQRGRCACRVTCPKNRQRVPCLKMLNLKKKRPFSLSAGFHSTSFGWL